MLEALTSFEAELDRLRRFLQASDAEDDLITNLLLRPKSERADLGEFLASIQEHSTIKRRQSYVSSIIVLYGALERYVEEAVAEYAKILGEIYQEFHKLPSSLRERHTKLTIDYLASLKDGRVRETENISAIVSALHDCLNGVGPFRLNARAFSLRSSNMKLVRIREIMNNLDVPLGGRRLLLTPAYTNFLENSFGNLVKDMQDGEVESTIDHIDELVSLRNDISHGVANLESIEGNDIVRERAAKLQAFVTAINQILTCELLRRRIEMQQFVVIEGNVLVFGDSIACFSWTEGRIAPGDILLMQPADQNADLRHGPISSIQIENVDQSEVQGRDGLMIGVQAPFKVKANGTFYVWRRE